MFLSTYSKTNKLSYFRLTGYDLFMLKMEMEEEGFIPHGINIGKTVLTLEDDSKFCQLLLPRCTTLKIVIGLKNIRAEHCNMIPWAYFFVN